MHQASCTFYILQGLTLIVKDYIPIYVLVHYMFITQLGESFLQGIPSLKFFISSFGPVRQVSSMLLAKIQNDLLDTYVISFKDRSNLGSQNVEPSRPFVNETWLGLNPLSPKVVPVVPSQHYQ